MNETSDSLLTRVRNSSDQDAWARLIDCYTPFMRAILLGRGISMDDVEDVTQNALAVVVRRIPDFDRRQVGSFRAWLRAICANCLREYWRAQGKRAPATGDSKLARVIQDLSDPASDLSHYWEEQHDRFVLAHLLGIVKDEFRSITFEAFRRLAIENDQVDAVANDLGITVNAAFIARSRVLKRLREVGAGMIE